nr:ribonuclease H-like domain-containing protein [Tanacetum cinerariifolium]
YDAMIELPKCVCNASEGFKKHNWLLKLMQFLLGLDDSYMQIRSTILSREVLLDVRSAYATISSEESHRVAVGSIVGFGLNNNRQDGGSGLVSENYDFNGHTIDRCFKIIGYPADFGKKKSGQNFKKQSVSNNNYVGKSSSSGFTDEQMATLISLIKYNKVRKNMQANMAESKRNDHLDNYRLQEQRNEGIPNKSHPNFREEHKSFSSIFVSNIPWNASVQDLWDICNKWGMVIDVYIAAKRSKSGHRFGFYGQTYNRPVERFGDGKPIVGSNFQSVSINKNVFQSFNSYDKAVLGNKSVDMSGKYGASNAGAESVGVSNCNKVHKESGNEVVMSISVDDGIDLDGMERSILAKVKDLSVISKLLKHMSSEGFDDVGLRYVGGRWISNDDERVVNNMNKGKSDSSSSSVSGSNINTADFLVDSGNDADSSDNLLATQNAKTLRQWNLKLTSTLIENGFSQKYRALASVNSEVILILKLLKDLQIEKLLPVSVHCDSNSAIKIADNPVFHGRTKHLKIDLHFVRERILKGVVKTVKVDSANQIANNLTKGLDKVQHLELVKRLGMYDIIRPKDEGLMLPSVDSYKSVVKML